MVNYPPVSIVIPVYNDAERLKLCLEALENQTYPDDRYEVIVIDNGSDEPLDEVVSQFPHARLTHEAKPGSYSARNKGLTVAKHDYLAFTDSDCIPEAEWLINGVSALKQSKADLVGGKVIVFSQDPAHPTTVELYEKIFAFPVETYVKKFNYAVTANLFTHQKVFDAIGNFDAGLISGGDNEWCRRAVSADHQLVYSKETIVAHPARYDFKELKQKIKRVSIGQQKLAQTNGCLFFTKFVPPLKSTYKIINYQNLQLSQKLGVILILWRIRFLIAWYHLKPT